jgi:hypothetical protein
MLKATVVARMCERFSSKVFLALQIQNPQLASNTYYRTDELPMTNTCIRLAAEYDIIVNDYEYGDGFRHQVCFLEGRPSVIKYVSCEELERAKALVQAMAEHRNLVKLRPIDLGHKRYVVMPFLPCLSA